MHLELPTVKTEGRVRDVVDFHMYIPTKIIGSRSEGVGGITTEVVAEVVVRVEPYQNISRG